MMRRLFDRAPLALLAFVVPPILLLFGLDLLAAALALAWVVAHGVFWFFAWGPGLLLVIAVGGIAFLLTLFGRTGAAPRTFVKD